MNGESRLPAFDATAGGGNLDGFEECLKQGSFPVPAGISAEEGGRFGGEPDRLGIVDGLPVPDDRVPAAVHQVFGGQFVTFAVFDLFIGGQEVPEAVVPPEGEGNGMIDVKGARLQFFS